MHAVMDASAGGRGAIMNRPPPPRQFVPALRTALEQAKGGKRFTFGSIGALAIYVLGAGLAFVTQLASARLLGANGFGEYAYVVAWISLLASLCTLGFQAALLRLLPAYASVGDWAEARGAAQFARRVTLAASVATAIAGSVFVASTLKERPTLAAAFFIGFAALPFVASQFVATSTSRAFGGLLLALAPDKIIRDSVVLVVVCSAAALGAGHTDAAFVAGAFLVGSVAAFALARAGASRLSPSQLRLAPARYRPREWLRLSAALIVVALADNLLSRSGVLALGLTGRNAQAGVFAVSVGFAQLAAMPRMAVAIMFAPSASSLHALGEIDALQKLLRRAAFLSLAGSLCVAGPLLLAMPLLMPMFGAEFAGGVTVSAILIGAQIFSASCGPHQHLLTMTGHERDGARLLALAACASMILCFALLPLMGMTGAAIGMAASQIGWNIAIARTVRRRLNIAPALRGGKGG